MLAKGIPKQSNASHFQQKRQCNSSPLKEDPEVEVLDGREASRASADGKMSAGSANPTVHEQVGVSAGSTGCPTASSRVGTLVQLESNHTVLSVPSNALAEDLTVDRPEEDPAQSVADIRVALPHVPSIDNTIDRLTADLAALCIDQLERSATLDCEGGDTNDLEDELQVRFKP